MTPTVSIIVPIESDEFRCTPDGRLRVFRTRNGGRWWEPLVRGLPQKRAYETILRDALTTDSLDPVGVYFGTRNGQIYGSADEGKTWRKIGDGFPSIVCVKAVQAGEPRAARKPAKARSQKSAAPGKGRYCPSRFTYQVRCVRLHPGTLKLR